MVLEGDRTVASVALEFDINAGTPGSWVNRHRIADAQEERQALSGPERARIRELERENWADLVQEPRDQPGERS
ncbi:transposase [Nonomuraea sp. NPDC052265]|uniref:transposase n=1 Tax=Nonomuraea sp. NPDC052265 TaxID=3364374 RepID=UPI0037C53B88